MGVLEAEPRQEPRDAMLRTALDCYLCAIMSVADCVSVLYPEAGVAHAQRLMRLRKRLAFDATLQTLEESRDALQNEVSGVCAQARQGQEVRSSEPREMLAALEETTNSIVARGARDTSWFRDLAQELERTAELDASEYRLRIGASIAQLRAFVDDARGERISELQGLREQIASFQERLKTAELLATMDAVTGLPNRREFDRQVASRIAAGREFCVLLFDMESFKEVNNRHGRFCGDQVLRQVGDRIAGQIRTRDFVCRWAGDEFLVIMECPLVNAEPRTRHMAQWLSGAYRVSSGAQEVEIDMRVSATVFAPVPQETAEQLARRADEALLSENVLAQAV
jgi:diguanylate cyclase (GGDEF)-like protein